MKKSYINKGVRYEQLKKALPQGLTPQEYEQAIKEICKRLGI